MSLVSWLPSWSGLHRAFARLHGVEAPEMQSTLEGPAADFASQYADYADSTAEASLALLKYRKGSQQFISADIASMKLFHRVKKMQGMKKAKPGQSTSVS